MESLPSIYIYTHIYIDIYWYIYIYYRWSFLLKCPFTIDFPGLISRWYLVASPSSRLGPSGEADQVLSPSISQCKRAIWLYTSYINHDITTQKPRLSWCIYIYIYVYIYINIYTHIYIYIMCVCVHVCVYYVVLYLLYLSYHLIPNKPKLLLINTC